MLKSFSTVTLGGIISTVATYTLTVILTHLLSVPEYGIIARWLTDIGYVSIFFTLGLNSSMIYFTRHNIPISSSVSLNVICYSLMLMLWVVGSSLLNMATVYSICLGLTVYFFSINEITRAKFQFDEKFGVFNFMVIFRPLLLVIVFGVLLMLGRQTLSDDVIIIYSCVMCLTAIIFSTIFFSKGGRFNAIPYDFPIKKYITYGSKSILNRLLSLTLYALSIYMVSWLGQPEYVAYFFVANSISKIAWVIPDSAGNILYPQFIKAGDKKSKNNAIRNMYTYAQIIFVLNILILVAFFVLGKWVINLLYEQTYTEAFIPTLILLIGNQGMVYYKLFSRWHASQNNWKHIYIATIFGVVVNLVLNYLLIPKLGIKGAAIATGCAFWICGIIICQPIKGSFWEFTNVFNLIRNRCKVLTK